jgi:hypothetical protein
MRHDHSKHAAPAAHRTPPRSPAQSFQRPRAPVAERT